MSKEGGGGTDLLLFTVVVVVTTIDILLDVHRPRSYNFKV